jgi:UTP--glucose-1-phosphate uridylyltransferase
MKITKAVIPAAGLGTRVLPATKAMPKEMFPLVDKPAIQYIVEEAANSGITDILIITNRGKGIIEDHFDRAPDLEKKLELNGKFESSETVKQISQIANIFFLRQKEIKGLGHAVLQSRTFIGNEPFAVLYGDDVIISKKAVCGQLIGIFEEFGLGVIGAQKIDGKFISNYSSLKVKKIREKVFLCSDMIEKPKINEIMSPYAILGRCVLIPEIFDILEKTPPGSGGEIQLTDAMKVLAQEQNMIAFEYDGVRYDVGSKLGTAKACVQIGSKHAEIGEEFKIFLKNFAENL